MSLTQEQIEKLCKRLSKIWVKNNSKLLKDINSIIWYIDILKNLDTRDVKPTISVISGENTLRDDIVKKEKETKPKELLDCSKQKVIWNQIAISDIMK